MQSQSSTSGLSNFAGTVQKIKNNKRSNQAKKIHHSGSWADLPQELLEVISNNLNVADYLSFGRVCRSWRLLYLESSKQRFMTSESPLVVYISTRAKKFCYFYDITAQISYKTKLPRYVCDFKFCLGVSSGYIIFMKDRLGSYFWLINPITGHQLQFPCMPIPLNIKEFYDCDIFRTAFASIGSQDQDFLLVILSKKGKNLQFCRSSDNQWKVYSYSGKGWHIVDIVVFNGRIFVITNDFQIGILNVRSSDLMFLKLKYSPRLRAYFRFIASNEQLLVVDLWEVHKIDFSRMEWIKVNNLVGQSLFTGNHDMMCSKLINPTKWGGQSNCTYRLLFSHTCVLYSLNGERLKAIHLPNLRGDSYPKLHSWYFLHQSNSMDNVRDD